METDQLATALPSVDERILIDELHELIDANPPDCECMLCDLDIGSQHKPITWRLVFEFNRAPAAEYGQDVMLLCDHCLHHWITYPDEHGGDPVRYHPI